MLHEIWKVKNQWSMLPSWFSWRAIAFKVWDAIVLLVRSIFFDWQHFLSGLAVNTICSIYFCHLVVTMTSTFLNSTKFQDFKRTNYPYAWTPSSLQMLWTIWSEKNLFFSVTSAFFSVVRQPMTFWLLNHNSSLLKTGLVMTKDVIHKQLTL